MPPPRKICTLDQLLKVREAAARDGKTVVHCHGCFDIVHPGHIQYLQFARSQGDVLIVSLTADPAVNKGVARPLIPQDLRAASVAALECVDFVYVNPHPTAVELLEALRPDLYVKGREYEANHDPRFLAERDTVTNHGGRVIFSSGEVVYSSTALIQSVSQNEAESFTDEKVRRFRQQYDLTPSGLFQMLHRFNGRKMVVIGDYICDRYHRCDATGVASEGPMMALRLLRSDDYDGGAAIVASHLAGLGADVTLITPLADDEMSRRAEARLAGRGVSVIPLRQRRELVTKHRYLVDRTKMMKIDDGAASPLDSAQAGHAADTVLAAADGAAGVIFADFGYGAITGGLLEKLMPALRPRVPIITADVSGHASLLRFRDVDLLCPTEREVRQTLNDFSSGLNAVIHRLFSTTGARQALITMGSQGLVAFDQCQPSRPGEAWERKLRSAYLPSLAASVVDPMGCGDALLATASLALAAGAPLHAAAYLGSIAAAIAGQSLGNNAVTADAFVARLNQSLPMLTRLAS
jgi:rfaE bifunctional protein kinase chain/domain/rfaE bifunctional protein nucleotidyltransferase chain/domain